MSFDRRIQIDIGQPTSLIALRVEGLRITFDILKDVKTTANHCRVQIFNLKPDTRNGIRELKDHLVVRAGYADETIDEIFHGNIMTISHLRQDGDIITSIEAGDGQTALRTAYSTLSYSEGTSMKQILQDCAMQMGLPIKSTDFLSAIPDQKFLQGFSFNGKSRDAMDKLTARAGLEWSIQGNQLQIIKKGGVVPKALHQIPVVSPNNGLVGSPERLTQIQDQSPEKKPPGWKITSCLIGRLEPGGQIGLQSDGEPKAKVFRIQAVNHKGDTHGDQFVSITEAIEPGTLIPGSVRLDLEPARAVA